MKRDKVASQRYFPPSPPFITKGSPKILRFNAAFLSASHYASLPFLLPPSSLPPRLLFQITSSNLKDRYWREMIETKFPSEKAENLNAALARVVGLFAVIFLQVGMREGTGGWWSCF